MSTKISVKARKAMLKAALTDKFKSQVNRLQERIQERIQNELRELPETKLAQDLTKEAQKRIVKDGIDKIGDQLNISEHSFLRLTSNVRIERNDVPQRASQCFIAPLDETLFELSYSASLDFFIPKTEFYGTPNYPVSLVSDLVEEAKELFDEITNLADDMWAVLCAVSTYKKLSEFTPVFESYYPKTSATTQLMPSDALLRVNSLITKKAA